MVQCHYPILHKHIGSSDLFRRLISISRCRGVEHAQAGDRIFRQAIYTLLSKHEPEVDIEIEI